MKTASVPVLVGALVLYIHTGAGFAQNDDVTFEDLQEDARELMAKIGDYSAEQRDEAIEATQRALDKMDAGIEEMEHKMREQWDSMDAAARKQSWESMATLRRERTELAEWYGAMKNSSAGAWDEMREGFADAFESLGEAWDRAIEKFEDDQ